MTRKVTITMSFEITTEIRDDQKPEDIVRMCASGYGLQNPKLIKVDEE